MNLLRIGMTFAAVAIWSFVCFAIYLLLECDGGMVVRYFFGVLIIGLYGPITDMIWMSRSEWKSFLLVSAGVASAILAVFICIHIVLG